MNALTRARIACLLGVVCFASFNAAHARTIYVNSSGTGDYTTLRAAVGVAASGDTIVLAPGTYTGGDAADLLLIGRALTIRSTDPNNPAVVARTVVDCWVQDEAGHRFFDLGSNAQLTLAGLTVINGARSHSGGVVRAENSILNIINCTFADNAVLEWGAAFRCEDSQAMFQGCTFLRNASATLHGGAVYGKNSTLTVIDCLFRENTGNGITGIDSRVTVTDSIFENNNGLEGGAIFNHVALGTETGDHLIVTRSTFAGNSATKTGGAIHSYASSVTISLSTFTGNTCLLDGGAIYNHRCATPSIVNCIFSGNQAAGLGGAVMDFYQSYSQIVHCTFVGNEATKGGAVASQRQSHPQISQSILWQNEAATGDSVYVWQDLVGTSYSQVSIAYSNVQSGRSGVFVEPGSVLNWGQGNIDADPLFTGLLYNDFHLSQNSPCIDAGDPTYVPPRGETDLDGLPRLYGVAVDMGAYEFQGLGPVYGFRSRTSAKQFYTMSADERDKLIQLQSAVWQYEGIVFYAFYDGSASNVAPAYRFWSDALGSHLWTTKEREKNKLITDPSFNRVWTYEGVSFYVYPPGKQPFGTIPLHRFWSNSLRHHFYTTQESEKNMLVAGFSDVWIYEGVAWYVYPTPYQLTTVTFDFSGASQEAWYTVTLRAEVDGKEATIDLPDIDFVPSSTHMRMTTDFTKLTTTLTEFRIRSAEISHTAAIRAGSVQIPFSLSGRGTFESGVARGPFTMDSLTGRFADFADAPQTFDAQKDTFTCSGLVRLGDQTLAFDRSASAVDFELSSYGTFESLDRLPDGINARVPLTFQWHRPRVKDLLVEATVDGRRVQLYITYMYAATEGLWQGAAVR